MSDKGRSGIHKHTNEDRNHRKRQHIDTENAVTHHKRYDDREHSYHRIEHENVSRFEEIVLAE